MSTYYLNYSNTNGLTVNSFKLEGAYTYLDINSLLFYGCCESDEEASCCVVDVTTVGLLNNTMKTLHSCIDSELRAHAIALITNTFDGGI